jgi:tetraacyldisaccharide 4'-kinase
VTVPRGLADRVARAARPDAPRPADRLLRAALAPASWAYGAAVRLRNLAYDAGLLPVHRLPCRVVCAGNLTVGGTGKTPLVLALADALVRQGAKPCILLRGYGGSATHPAVVSDGRQVLLDWRQAGDEAVLLARRLPGVPVVVGGDRVQAGAAALARFRPDVLLLDDGFQHRRLHRDVDLVLLDAADPWGGARLLPAGRLREPVAGLRRAHAVIVTRADEAKDREALRRRLERAGITRLAWARHRPTTLVEPGGGGERPAEALRGRAAYAMSGIGRPDSFRRSLEALGARVVGGEAFPDHHPYDEDDRAAVSAAAGASGAEWIVTTEKDLVRLGPARELGRPVLALRIAMELLDGAEALAPLLGARLPEAQGV